MAEEESSKPPGKLVQSISLAVIVLRNRKWRRNLLFGLTLLTLFLVFGGIVFLGDRLMNRPLAFLTFWGICFLLVFFVLMLALYDVLIVRRGHRLKMRELEKQLADAASEAREKEEGGFSEE